MKRMAIMSNGSLMSPILVLYLGLPFILSLQDGQKNEIFPFHAHLILTIHFILFCIVLPFLRIKLSKANLIIFLVWSFLFCWALLSVFWSTYPILVLQRSLMIFVTTYFLLLIIFSDNEPLRSFYNVMFFLMWLGVGLAFIGLLILVTGDIVWIDNHRVGVLTFGPLVLEQRIYGLAPLLRISSLTGNPNTLASIMLITISATVSLFFAGYLKRFSFILIILIQLLALVMTFSRAGIGLTIITLSILFVLRSRRLWSRLGIILLIVTLIGSMLVISFLVFPDSIKQGIERRIGQGLNLRGEIWIPLVNSIIEKPLTGVGFGVSSEAILMPHNINLAAHNFHLAILAETGVFSYIIILGLWVYGVIQGFLHGMKQKEKRKKIAFLTIGVLLMIFLIYQFFEGSLMRFGASHWVWIYLIASAVNLRTKSW